MRLTLENLQLKQRIEAAESARQVRVQAWNDVAAMGVKLSTSAPQYQTLLGNTTTTTSSGLNFPIGLPLSKAAIIGSRRVAKEVPYTRVTTSLYTDILDPLNYVPDPNNTSIRCVADYDTRTRVSLIAALGPGHCTVPNVIDINNNNCHSVAEDFYPSLNYPNGQQLIFTTYVTKAMQYLDIRVYDLYTALSRAYANDTPV